MLFKAFLSASLLALGVNAAAVATGKSFKFQVLDPVHGKVFLADATGKSTADESKALVCELNADVLTCGGKGFPAFSGDMTKLATITGSPSKGWSIDANDNIVWNAQSNIKFSIGISGGTDVWAETCPHHWTEKQHGTAKAVYVTA
ncbi:hypothetical protein QBC47DRAFT_397484 [Echria macrotheca]|uniref:AA1-like domain-containing protein n=1 Tax=Echria macrotheca TaxID=438768 RepID=A0AAJ0FFM2_9PEZI|nr:hypothetical protein QBC47DRAFT_397484 [Echria macrotheca]